MSNKPVFEEISDDEEIDETNMAEGVFDDGRNHSRSNRRNNSSSFGRNSFFDDDDDDSFFGNSGFGGFGGFGGSLFDKFGGFGRDKFFDSEMDFNSSGNGNTKFFSSSSVTTSVNGVTQTAKKVKSSDGREKVFLQRKNGDKKVSLEKIKEKDGTETVNKKLENINEDQLAEFDKQFKSLNNRSIGMGFFGNKQRSPLQAIKGSTENSKKAKGKKTRKMKKKKNPSLLKKKKSYRL